MLPIAESVRVFGCVNFGQKYDLSGVQDLSVWTGFTRIRRYTFLSLALPFS